MNASVTIPRKTFLQRLKSDLRRHWLIYMLGFLCLVYYFIFCYLPMGGIVIAFKDFRPARAFSAASGPIHGTSTLTSF